MKDNDPCVSIPCLNHGTCVSNPFTCTYSCQCSPGYTGTCCGQGSIT